MNIYILCFMLTNWPTASVTVFRPRAKSKSKFWLKCRSNPMWTVTVLHETGRYKSDRLKEDDEKVNDSKVEGPEGKFRAMRVFIFRYFLLLLSRRAHQQLQC